MMKKLQGMLARIGAWIDDLLFPQDVVCLCCDCALDDAAHSGICRSCIMALEELARRQEQTEAKDKRPLPEGVGYIHAAYVYEGQARKLIHRLKYDSVRRAAVVLAQRMAYLPSGEEEIIVPVPTDPARERRRGFNQSALLARHIGKELGMQVMPALVRVQARRPQTGLSAGERRKNVAGCMEADGAVSGKRVLLVDDVCTTGATLQEAARALHAAGAGSVGAFTAARASDASWDAADPFAVDKERSE